MINSILSNADSIIKYSYENQPNKQCNDSNTSTLNAEKNTLGKDTFEKSDEPTIAEKEQSSLEKLYSYAKNNTTKILTQAQIDSTTESRVKEALSAFDSIIEYVKTPDGQKKGHEYENALKDEKIAKSQGKSQEELSELSKNSYTKEMSFLDNISGVSDSAKQVAMKMINVISSSSLKEGYQLITKKNDESLSNNAKNYLSKLRQDNPDTAICINNSNNFSMSGDYVGYYTNIDKNLFELMSNNQNHDDIWSKLINNQYDNFDSVINDIYNSGDSTLANEFKSNTEDHKSKITKYSYL